jgi:hypothetical protein
MDEKQLKAAIKMGRDIADGKVELVGLDNRSLELRGKKQKRAKVKTDDSKDDSRSSRPTAKGGKVEDERALDSADAEGKISADGSKKEVRKSSPSKQTNAAKSKAANGRKKPTSKGPAKTS